jgi:hypothetical protein
MNEFKLSYEQFFAATRQHFFACEAACACHVGIDEVVLFGRLQRDAAARASR